MSRRGSRNDATERTSSLCDQENVFSTPVNPVPNQSLLFSTASQDQHDCRQNSSGRDSNGMPPPAATPLRPVQLNFHSNTYPLTPQTPSNQHFIVEPVSPSSYFIGGSNQDIRQGGVVEQRVHGTLESPFSGYRINAGGFVPENWGLDTVQDGVLLSPLDVPDHDLEVIPISSNLSHSLGDLVLDEHKPAKQTTLSTVIKTLNRSLKLTATTFLLKILHSTHKDDELFAAHTKFYDPDNHKNVHDILTAIYKHKSGKVLLQNWMRESGIDIVCDIIDEEMDLAKPSLHMTTNNVSNTFIDTFDLNGIMDPVKKITPTWSRILEKATSPSKRAGVSVMDEHKRNRYTARNMISSQVHYLRSLASCKVQIAMGIFAFTMGASRALVEVLHNAGICRGYTTTQDLLKVLEKSSQGQASEVANGAHGNGYDNLNTTHSIHVEQRSDAPSKVQSGTFSLIYETVNGRLEDMKLAPIMENLRKACPLKITDLRLSCEQKGAYNHQSTVNIVNILLKHKLATIPPTSTPSVSADDPLLQHKPRRPLPKGQKTKFYPLSASTIEEASVEGNIQVHNNMYIDQLKKSPDKLSLHAIPSFNDQLTNARIRGAQELRADDVNAWERRDVFQLAFGTFHMMMNLIWALLHIHRGHESKLGTLSYYFSVLEKVRLGSDRPDYHTLLASLTQILEGLILNAWEMECGKATLEEFLCASDTTPDKLLQVAKSIIKKYATVSTPDTEDLTPVENDNKTAGSQKDHSPKGDAVSHNTRVLTRDLLYIIELVSAVRAGDFGRVEDLLPDLACIFRGAGSTNYSLELLHFIFQVKEVWPAEFANIMRDLMIVNPTGLDGHGQGIDLNIEHLIGYIKLLFMAKGIHADWDRVGVISACINHLYILKRRVTAAFGASYSGRTHRTPDTTNLVLRIAAKARENLLQTEVHNRADEVIPKRVIDARKAGYDKLRSSGLASFNKKIEAKKTGTNIDVEDESDGEADELLPSLDITVDMDAELFE